MVVRTAEVLPQLFEADETAWLEAMSRLIHDGRLEQLDYSHLAEYLSDMARRDKREVMSRLAVLIANLLKWVHQKEKRSGSWRENIEVQRQELADLLASGVRRQHALEIMSRAYANGVRQAVAQSGLPDSTFPDECPYSLDEILTDEFGVAAT